MIRAWAYMARGWSWTGLKSMTGLSVPVLVALMFGTVIVIGLIVMGIAYFVIGGGYQFPNIGKSATIAIATLFLLFVLIVAVFGRRIRFNK
jgi:hypothetical protein